MGRPQIEMPEIKIHLIFGEKEITQEEYGRLTIVNPSISKIVNDVVDRNLPKTEKEKKAFEKKYAKRLKDLDEGEWY